ncbi:MAG TPA: hypothetical protein VK553_09750 [Candidatus Nitrosopolaris rasttigaisensis]|nr:hypothetical protein [Candidatus Nitrosopolaris rasttigaisensis]
MIVHTYLTCSCHTRQASIATTTPNYTSKDYQPIIGEEIKELALPSRRKYYKLDQAGRSAIQKRYPFRQDSNPGQK